MEHRNAKIADENRSLFTCVYYTYIRKRKNRGRQEWLARLIWEDEAMNEGGEMCRSAESRSEAQRKLKSLEAKFLAEGKAMVQAALTCP